MPFDPPLAAPGVSGPETRDSRRHKVRIRFKKGGNLRLVSHHDLMHCFERMFRRATLPFRSTEGFNPKPKMAFALSLALGIVGAEEVLELELDEDLSPDEIQNRLACQAPAGLEILSVVSIDRRTRAQVRRVCYRLPLTADQKTGLAKRCGALLAETNLWVERARPQPRKLDLRPYVRGLQVVHDAHSDSFLEMDLWVTPYGAARPEEILGLLGLKDLLDAGAVLERTKLALHDEDQTPDSGPTVAPLPSRERAAVPKSTPLPAPLLPGPLSFDS
jgi:radical SAM-linked protein